MDQYWSSTTQPTVPPAGPVKDGVRWNRAFANRQPELYPNEDRRININSKDSSIDVFLGCMSLQLQPPQRFQALRLFLESDHRSQSGGHHLTRPLTIDGVAIVDDRCDATPKIDLPGQSGPVQFVRAWDSRYLNHPPIGLNPRVNILGPKQLFHHLDKDRKGVAERRILYIANLNSKMAMAVIQTVSYTHLPEIRSFLARHIGLDPYMNVYQSPGFVLEFHLPHFVLRPNQLNCRDERGLRKSRYFLPNDKTRNGRHCIYEAQTSMIVYGTDEFFWSAYFFVDTYYGGQESADRYVLDKIDAPSGGYLQHDAPIWDPRYYFLTIFSVRLGQITMEWTVLVREAEKILDPESELNEQTLSAFIEHDPSVERTKQRTWTLCILRRLRNSLAKLITVWHAFDADQSAYFDLDMPGNLQDKFRERFSHMRGKVAELRALHLTLEQRIETLEKISDELVNASSLSESITATRQGKNIQILTYITIIYLPVTLITGCFGMNQVPETVPWWNYWVLLGGLTSLTIAVALVMPRAMSLWTAKKASKTQKRLPYYAIQ